MLESIKFCAIHDIDIFITSHILVSILFLYVTFPEKILHYVVLKTTILVENVSILENFFILYDMVPD